MKKNIFLFISAFYSSLLSAQVNSRGAEKFIPQVYFITHKLGSTDVRLKMLQYGPVSNYLFINLHDDENTSVEGVSNTLENNGGTLIKIENNGKRNIQFRHRGKNYSIDPNRIFSRTGIRKTLAQSGKVNSKLVDEVGSFASHILKLIPGETRFVIALHNNANGNLSVTEYLPGNKREKDAQKVFVATGQDPDDFFLTTDSLFFQYLSASHFNSILQDDINVEQDGSLSVYFGGKNISYLNCEAEHGRVAQYERMIAAALKYITAKN
ncbi:hypothetical protein [Terrimonas alba]|uniref:hypothetical protein n=1 Tax=Terrimonas alba TaxID=3349636 RepID=UPI0035F2F89D